jgi:hypothetical protein
MFSALDGEIGLAVWVVAVWLLAGEGATTAVASVTVAMSVAVFCA